MSTDRAGARGEPLERRRRLSDDLLRVCPTPVALVDVRSRTVLRANRPLAFLLGHLPTELCGMPLDRFDTADEGDTGEWLLASLAAQDSTPSRRLYRAFDGAEIPVEVHATRMDGAGTPVLALFVRDVRPEATLRQEMGELKSQLWMAQKHEVVGRMAAGIAHDFSNLLSVVILTTDTLRTALQDDPEAQVELDAITDVGFRARDLTAKLVAFASQSTAGTEHVSVNDVLREMEGLLQRALTEDIELAMRLCDGAAGVSMDPTHLQQVVLNLAVNARDAMPHGGHLVVATDVVDVDEDGARALALSAPGHHVLLSVSDTGAGMEDDVLHRIFRPFFSTRSEDPGAGLGLPTVQSIVQASGGIIRASSTPGAGTTFRVYLPLVQQAPRSVEGPRGRRVGGLPGGTEHILVVEDDDIVRAKTAQVLERLGYKVTQTASPDDAILIHDDLWPRSGPHPIDLVLTDVIMPEMSGVELVKRIRVKREDLPAVFMSGHFDPGYGGQRPEAGSPYLAKPFTGEELALSVRRTLDAEQGESDAHLPPDLPA